ncbi:MAG: hypothetical protein IE937_03815 [Gammaproteobacteria bacterium]|nr:hypothetical protein [Gammaproteobacteria bacterium]MBD3777582.1 hypothetical protein [Thiotrichales bacterium]
MSTISPVLSTMALNAQSAVTNPVTTPEMRMAQQAASTATASGNTTVTLSAQATQLSQQDLATSQRVNTADALETRETESQQSDSGLTYIANLQSRANYQQAINPLEGSESEARSDRDDQY